MSGISSAVVRELMAAGIVGDALLSALERIEDAARREPSETPEERKKRVSRETSQRYRASRNVTNASPDVTEEDVTKRHQTSRGDTAMSPLARVVDINPSTEITGIISSISKTRECPDWKTMLVEARQAAGDVGDFTRPAMLHAGDLRRLVEPLSGEPCEWSEVLDAIRMTCARQAARGKQLTTWAWVRDDAIALRDKRLTAHMPSPKVVEIRSAFLTSGERAAAARAEGRRMYFEKFGGTDEASNL